jgi:hypothetical protein
MRAAAAILLVLSMTMNGWAQQTCSNYNSNLRILFQMSNLNDHRQSPGHSATTTYNASCTYNGGNPPGSPCNVFCNEDGRSALVTSEQFSTVDPSPFGVFHHIVNTTAVTGSANSNGASVSCASTIAVATTRCLVLLSCTATVSISASQSGIGANVSFPPGSIWNDSDSDLTTCMPEKSNPFGTPIIIDLGGGYDLSLLKDGVPFDFFGTGMYMTSWPEPGAANGFLVLPDQDGMVLTAKQMFGNQAGYPNGFEQLKQYDLNHDGVIDAQDPVFNDLYVWVDTSHDGISQPGEMHKLAGLMLTDGDRVEGILLQYKRSPYIDANGNAFGLKGSLIVSTPRGREEREALYDVTLQFRRLF